MVIRRGEIWWAELAEPRGSEPGYDRPVVIIQSDVFNHTSINTVLATTITSNLRMEGMPGNVHLSKKISGLTKPSVVNVTQLVTLNKSWLKSKVKQLPQDAMAEIEAGIRLVLALR
jgi:mRNA interferase MazF